MSEQLSEHQSEPRGYPTPMPPPAPVAPQGYADILEDIDEILEENALTFVNNFVQLGGQ